jgi:glucose-6-phosphate isomerase
MEPTSVSNLPISVQLDSTTGVFSPCPQYTQRRVSDLAKMFYDQQAVEAIQKAGDRLVYEIRYYPFLTSNSDMTLGVTAINPGTVGDEYYMTKGHFHERDDQPEIYYCVQGEGLLLMETLQGDFRVASWKPGIITHIPPMYAHRVVNTGKITLVFVATFHLSAGHVYGPVEAHGFERVVIERNGSPMLLPNPRRV